MSLRIAERFARRSIMSGPRSGAGMRVFLILVVLVSVASAAPSVRDGANHHLGDDSFVARYGRAPTDADPNETRMHVHLEYVRALLAGRPATRPELEARRAELLGYLGDYIAAGITPENTYVAHRSPVFIDAAGRICAVGYLIQRSAGRALAEKIAKLHRLDYLEDIAAAMPEVAAWVASSGFTLEELASIQPGYPGPEVMHVDGFVKDDMPDGDYKNTGEDGSITTGKFAKHQMTGEWKRVDAKGTVLGSGTFKNGSGTWTSFTADGNTLAKGTFDASRAEGDWKIFYPSGKVAAQGEMHKGRRNGTWTFYYDDGKTKLSVGKFDKGETVGPWKHYGRDGKLVATATGKPWQHLMLSIEPKDGVRHEIDQGYPAESYRVDAFFLGDDKLYIRDRARFYDGEANLLDKVDGAWVAHACKWSKARLRAAKGGDTAAMFASFSSDHATDATDGKDEDGECMGDPKPVPKAKAERLDKMLASRALVHAPIPANPFHVATDADNQHYEDDDASPLAGRDNDADFATYLADHMTWYIEYPHVDDPFTALYASLPGHKTMQDEFPSTN